MRRQRPITIGWLVAFGLLTLVAAEAPERHPGVAGDVRYEIEISLQPEHRRLDAAASLWLREMGPDEPTLVLDGSLNVVRVEIDGRPVEVENRLADGRRRIRPLHGTALPGEHQFRVVYGGEIAREPTGGSEGRIRSDGVFLPPAAGWYPTVPGLEGPAIFRVTADLPGGWEAIAEGRLDRAVSAGGRERIVYSSGVAIPGIHLLAGPWRRTERDHGGYVIAAYLGSDDAERAEHYLAEVGRYLDLYTDRFGPSPWTRFSVVEGAVGAAHGLPGIALVDGRGARRGSPGGTTGLGHHVAHGWWGNGVLADDRTDGWVEGLTGHLAEHHDRRLEGAAAAAAYRRSICRRHAESAGSGRAVADGSTPPDRSTMVFHMLERRLGRERFDETLREVYRRNLHRPISWPIWREVSSRVSGEDLGWFFEQWTRREGIPALELADVKLRAIRGREHLEQEGFLRPFFEISGVLRQSGGDWRLRVPIAVQAGEQVFRRSVEIAGPSTRFRLRVPAVPDIVRVDPDQDLLRRPDTGWAEEGGPDGPLVHRFQGP